MRLLFLLFISWLLLGSPLAAAEISGQYQARAFAETQADNGSGLVNFDVPGPFTVPSLSYSASGIFEGTIDMNANASIAGSATYGVFKAYAHADSSLSRLSSDIASGYAYIELEAIDYITPMSSTLAQGTPVQVEFTSVLDGSLAVSAYMLSNGSPSCNSQAFLEFGGPAGRFEIFGCNNPGAFSQTLDQVQTLRIGQPFEVFETLSVEASAGSGYPSSGTVSALDTASLTINVLTPGVTFTSESGSTYSSAMTSIPEPDFRFVLPLLLYLVIGGYRFRHSD